MRMAVRHAARHDQAPRNKQKQSVASPQPQAPNAETPPDRRLLLCQAAREHKLCVVARAPPHGYVVLLVAARERRDGLLRSGWRGRGGAQPQKTPARPVSIHCALLRQRATQPQAPLAGVRAAPSARMRRHHDAPLRTKDASQG